MPKFIEKNKVCKKTLETFCFYGKILCIFIQNIFKEELQKDDEKSP